ncbi:MAG: RNA polymerase sigma factor [Polyangiaceae bacterium]
MGHFARAGEQAAGAAEKTVSAEDRAILDAIGDGRHREALALCVRHHGTAIGRLCMALTGSASEADDLTQETLLDAHAGFAGFRADGSLRAWLFTIARRKCARHIERTSRQRSRLRLVVDASRADTTEDLVVRRQRAERARAMLEQIRPSEREAIWLRYGGELSFREVGDACGIDEAAARKRVSRALCRLRDAVGSKE